MSHLLPHEALAEYEDGRLTWAEILTSYPFLIPTILKLCGDTEQLTSDTRDRTWGTLQGRRTQWEFIGEAEDWDNPARRVRVMRRKTNGNIIYLRI